MTETDFFDEQSDESGVKARIVQKYFDAWSKVMVAVTKKSGRDRIAYIDLYAGRGRYKDGSASTPLLVLQKAVSSPDLCNMLLTVFNDKDEASVQTLRSEIARISGISNLKHQPIVLNDEIDDDWASQFERIRLVPTFSFIDPWGYKSLSQRLLSSFIREWGCDCVFFFNYRRINAAFSNSLFNAHVDALFGTERAKRLRDQLANLRPTEREAIILDGLAQSLKELGGKFVLPFVFKDEGGKRTTHCLVFISKGEKGFEIMKNIMAKESSVADQGVPSFAYSPADERTPLLFSLFRPLERLEDMLLESFAGRTMTMEQIYHAHHVNHHYIEKNYKEALLNLERTGKIDVDPRKRKAGTFGAAVRVTFPTRS